jgi:hypothetical protein
VFGVGQSEGPDPLDWESRPYDRSRCAAHGVLQVQIGMVCASHRG